MTPPWSRVITEQYIRLLQVWVGAFNLFLINMQLLLVSRSLNWRATVVAQHHGIWWPQVHHDTTMVQSDH